MFIYSHINIVFRQSERALHVDYFIIIVSSFYFYNVIIIWGIAFIFTSVQFIFWFHDALQGD